MVLASLRRGRAERETMLQACAGLYAAGSDPDWKAVEPTADRSPRCRLSLAASAALDQAAAGHASRDFAPTVIRCSGAHRGSGV